MASVLSFSIFFFLILFDCCRGQSDFNYTFLSNEFIKVGLNLDRGGSIGWVGSAGGQDNIVNEHDMGREVQLSFYAAPRGYDTPTKNCSSVQFGPYIDFPWNPIGAGDLMGNAGQVIEVQANATNAYIKSLPLMWACDNVPCQCYFEKWLELDGIGVTVRARLTNQRTDSYEFAPFGQELPAVYVNAGYRTAVVYDGLLPWTNDTLSYYVNGSFQFQSGEQWIALVNDSGNGLGLFLDNMYTFAAAPNLVPGDIAPTPDPSHQNPTGYLNSNRLEILSPTLTYEYTFSLIFGSVQDIRLWASNRAFGAPGLLPPMKGPGSSTFVFGTPVNPRAGFTYSPLVTDSVEDSFLEVIMSANDSDPQMLGPAFWWYAAAVPQLTLTASFNVSGVAQLFWSVAGNSSGYLATQMVQVQVMASGVPQKYVFDLCSNENYTGIINSIRLDPLVQGPGLMNIYSLTAD